MTQEKYISESTQDIIIRARKMLEEPLTIDLRNWKSPIHIDGDNNNQDNNNNNQDNNNNNQDNNGDIPVTYPLCSHIILKNKITITDTSIVTCTGTAIITCTIGCPTGDITTHDTYINMLAIVNLVGIAQTGVVIQFHYLINNIPVTDLLLTNVTVSLVPGNNYVYLFPTNKMYSPNTMITFYGALVISQ